MSQSIKNSYGCWSSPITSDLVVEKTVKFIGIASDGNDIYWNEMRPNEKGRCVIIKKEVNGNISEVLPEGYSARSRVHEYGGGDFTVKNEEVYFSNFRDQRIYKS